MSEEVKEPTIKEEMNKILDSLTAQGFNDSYIERSLDLRHGCLKEWRKGEFSRVDLSLMNIVFTYPWMMEVALMGFHEDAKLRALGMLNRGAGI